MASGSVVGRALEMRRYFEIWAGTAATVGKGSAGVLRK
jgi:hypothetical protein